MEQLLKIPKGMKLSGARGGDICSCHTLALEAWGNQAEDNENSGLTGMAYLFRRFGPPFWGTDADKRIASYVLTTSDPEVFLECIPSGSPMAYNVGFLINRNLWEDFHEPNRARENKFHEYFISQNPSLNPESKEFQDLYSEWRFDAAKIAECRSSVVLPELPPLAENWKAGPPIMKRVNNALLEAMKELLRPVGVRDCAINIFGRCDEVDMERAERSKFAGFGVPIKPMLKLIEKEQNDSDRT